MCLFQKAHWNSPGNQSNALGGLKKKKKGKIDYVFLDNVLSNAFMCFRAQFILQYLLLKHCGVQLGHLQLGPPLSESLHPPKHHPSVGEVD